LEQSLTQHIKMRTVTFNVTRFQVSEDPDKLIADFLALVLSDYYILQAEQLFIPDGEGIDDLYGDVNIYAYRKEKWRRKKKRQQMVISLLCLLNAIRRIAILLG
jgi:hypothetical protein